MLSLPYRWSLPCLIKFLSVSLIFPVSSLSPRHRLIYILSFLRNKLNADQTLQQMTQAFQFPNIAKLYIFMWRDILPCHSPLRCTPVDYALGAESKLRGAGEWTNEKHVIVGYLVQASFFFLCFFKFTYRVRGRKVVSGKCGWEVWCFSFKFELMFLCSLLWITSITGWRLLTDRIRRMNYSNSILLLFFIYTYTSPSRQIIF